MEARQEQLRAAKQRQRLKDRREGQAPYQVKLPIELRERLKAGMKSAGFVSRFHAFLRHEVVRVDAYPSLALHCWNRDLEYMTREDAFRLYERSWRLIDARSLAEHERALIGELKDELGRGLINA